MVTAYAAARIAANPGNIKRHLAVWARTARLTAKSFNDTR